MFYEEAARMPFVIRYPGKLPAGKRVKDLILNVDFAPTLAQLAGVKPTKEMQGHSFVDNLCGKTPTDWRRSFIIVTGHIILFVLLIWEFVMNVINLFSIMANHWI